MGASPAQRRAWRNQKDRKRPPDKALCKGFHRATKAMFWRLRGLPDRYIDTDPIERYPNRDAALARTFSVFLDD